MTKNRIQVVSNLWVCVDCIMMIANGEAPEDDATEARILEALELEAAAGGHWCCEGLHEGESEGDDTLEFSWAPCELCRSHLGGARHRAAVVYQNGKHDAADR